MTNGCVLDVLICVYDQYMTSDPADIPGRAAMLAELVRRGFTVSEVMQAMEWLSVLAAGTEGPAPPEAPPPGPADANAGVRGNSPRSLRVYSGGELCRLSTPCRSFLARLDRDGVLSPGQRELVIERTLALDVEEPSLEHLRWVVLLVLSIQPQQDAAFARFEALMAGERSSMRH